MNKDKSASNETAKTAEKVLAECNYREDWYNHDDWSNYYGYPRCYYDGCVDYTGYGACGIYPPPVYGVRHKCGRHRYYWW